MSPPDACFATKAVLGAQVPQAVRRSHPRANLHSQSSAALANAVRTCPLSARRLRPSQSSFGICHRDCFHANECAQGLRPRMREPWQDLDTVALGSEIHVLLTAS